MAIDALRVGRSLRHGTDVAATSSAAESSSLVGAASARHVLGRAAMIGLLMRHSITTGVAVIGLIAPDSGIRLGGYVLLAAVLCWSIYRLMTRSHASMLIVADVAVALAVALAIPVLTEDPRFYLTNSVPQAIAGTAVISVAVSLPARWTLPLAATIATGYAVGTSSVTGWAQVGSVLAVYYFALQWTTAASIRLMLLRVATVVDAAREHREVAEAARDVDEAVRVFDREQLALLHDTVASTLLMVGQGVSLPAERLAAQARRDMDLLSDGPWRPADQPMDIVDALSELVTHVRTPVRLTGLTRLRVDGTVAQAVVASCREGLNNVDRHAQANDVRVDFSVDRVIIADDGVGFGPTSPHGHGIAHSMTARMHRVGGTVYIQSAPDAGTRVEIRWPTALTGEPARTAPTTPKDPERLIARVRMIYAAALVAYAVANLLITVPYALTPARDQGQLALAVIAVMCTIAALATMRTARPAVVWACLVLLFGVTLIQPLTLEPDQIGSQDDWVQSGIGWCALPLVLSMPVRRGAGILVGFWLAGAVIELALHSDASSWVNVGLGTGSILGVQLFALAFDGLVRGAATHVHADIDARKRLLVDEEVARTVTADYRRRYASHISSIVPLLKQLSVRGTVDPELRSRAATHSRHLRALFDQSGTFEHPLAEGLRAVIEDAQARSVDIEMEFSGTLPQISEPDVAIICAPVWQVLTVTMTGARVVVRAGSDALSVSVVCHGIVDPDSAAATLRDTHGNVVVTTAADTVWLIVDRPVRDGKCSR